MIVYLDPSSCSVTNNQGALSWDIKYPTMIPNDGLCLHIYDDQKGSFLKAADPTVFCSEKTSLSIKKICFNNDVDNKDVEILYDKSIVHVTG